MNRRQISSRTASIAMLLICTLSLAGGGGGGGGGGGVITPGGVDLRITKDDGGATLTLAGFVSVDTSDITVTAGLRIGDGADAVDVDVELAIDAAGWHGTATSTTSKSPETISNTTRATKTPARN